MIELYFIFLLAAGLLFAVIVGYSLFQKRRREAAPKKVEIEPVIEISEEETAYESGDNQVVLNSTAKAPLLTKSEAQKKADFAQQERQQNSQKLSEPSIGEQTKSAPESASYETSANTEPNALPADPSTTKNSDGNVNGNGNGNLNHSPGEPDAVAEDDKLKIDASGNIITELVAKINIPEMREQQDLLALLRLHDFKFHRRINLYGLNQMTERWSDIEFEQPSSRFVELGLSMQLADRNGAMSSKELHDFQQMTLAFSNRFDAPFEFSFDIDDAFKQARMLDEIGRRYDSMAVLNVVPRSKAGFRIADIESCAREMMMSTDKKGIYIKSKGHKSDLTVLYRLACTDGTGQFGVNGANGNIVHDLVIYMKVPATEEPDRVFQDMVKDANNLATWLEGKVVDRNSKVMTQRSYSILMQQISDIAFSMQQDGLSPGDPVSKKLF